MVCVAVSKLGCSSLVIVDSGAKVMTDARPWGIAVKAIAASHPSHRWSYVRISASRNTRVHFHYSCSVATKQSRFKSSGLQRLGCHTDSDVDDLRHRLVLGCSSHSSTRRTSDVNSCRLIEHLLWVSKCLITGSIFTNARWIQRTLSKNVDKVVKIIIMRCIIYGGVTSLAKKKQRHSLIHSYPFINNHDDRTHHVQWKTCRI